MAIQTEVLVPVRGNDGIAFPLSAFRELELQFTDTFGGWTGRPECRGEWKGLDGTLYSDLTRPYQVDLQSWTQLPAYLAIVEWARVRFGQEAMHVCIAGVPENLGPAP